MASELLAELYNESLGFDPYRDREYLADSVGDPPSQFSGSEARAYWRNTLAFYGKNLWRFSRMALNYWTPERVEEAAYRRAADSPSVSKIAKEVARFNVIYAKWVELAQGFLSDVVIALPSGATAIADDVRFMRESIAETLLALERRAQAAEQRATDLRLRYEFDKLRAVVNGGQLASQVAELIEAAAANAGTEKVVYEQFAPALARLEKQVGDTKLDVDFVADLVGEEFVKKQLPSANIQAAVAKLIELVPGTSGKVLAALAKFVLRG